MAERSGPGMTGSRRHTPAQVFDLLREVATLEQAHCVHHLRLHSALDGHAEQRDPQVPDGIRAAAGVAFAIAMGDMFHLRDVNRVLVLGGREPVLDRTAPAPMTPARFARFPARERALASTLDRTYARLVHAVASPTKPPLPDDVLSEIENVVAFVSGEGLDHTSRVPALADALAGLTPAQYLRVTGVAPADELDRRLLAMSDELYGSLLALLHDHLSDTGGDGLRLRQFAVSRMEDLHKVNGLLGLRGLLPPFSAA